MKGTVTLSVIDLVVLGLLMDEPMNAYYLAQITEERQLGRLVKLSKPAIYKSCRRLADAGYLSGKVVRESEAPEKVVYTVSEAGREHFHRLMEHFSSNISSFHFDFNSFIWNLHRLDRAEGMAMLEGLLSELNEIRRWLVAHERENRTDPKLSFGAKMVVKQYRMVFTTLVKWAESTIEEYRSSSVGLR